MSSRRQSQTSRFHVEPHTELILAIPDSDLSNLPFVNKLHFAVSFIELRKRIIKRLGYLASLFRLSFYIIGV